MCIEFGKARSNKALPVKYELFLPLIKQFYLTKILQSSIEIWKKKCWDFWRKLSQEMRKLSQDMSLITIEFCAIWSISLISGQIKRLLSHIIYSGYTIFLSWNLYIKNIKKKKTPRNTMSICHFIAIFPYRNHMQQISMSVQTKQNLFK